MKYHRKESKCNECPLEGERKVDGNGAFSSHLALYGEAPGAEEAVEGKPFVGPAGRFLNWGLFEAGVYRHQSFVGNVLTCRPPKNDYNSFDGVEAQKACRSGFLEELGFLKKQGITTILAFGNNVLKGFGIEGKISKVRGSVYQRHGMVVIPTFHPSFLNRRVGYKKTGTEGGFGTKVDPKYIWLADIAKAQRLAKEGWSPPKENFNVKPTLNELRDFITRCRNRNKLIGVDIETTGLNLDYATIVVIGLASSSTAAISVPLIIKGPKGYWKNGEQSEVRKVLDKLFQNNPLAFQNALFDVPFLQQEGYKISFSNVAHDSMLLHHCLSGDTEIDTLDWGKVPIEDLENKKNFWVVSHDGMTRVPKKVKACWKHQEKRDDLLRITFWSKNRVDKSHLWIDCTPEHEVPIQGMGKIEVRDLKVGDRLFPGQTCKHQIGTELISHWVYRNIFKEDLKDLQIHHLDGDHWNNNPANLKKVTKSEHNSHHKDVQYRATMQLQREAKERVLKEFDSEKVYELYFKVGLSFREVAEELDTSPDRVRRLFKVEGWKGRTRSKANVLRWQKQHNCRILSITPLKGEYDVYDMEVPGTHTFSANGVIVGNCISPELPHDLGFIVSLYGSTPYWKADFLGRDGGILDMDDEERHVYNLRDCVVLHQIIPPMLSDLKEMGTEATYYSESLRLLKPIAQMEKNGILLSPGKLTKFKQFVEAELQQLSKVLKKEGDLPDVFNLGSNSDMRYFLFNFTPTKFSKLGELKEYEEGTVTRIDKKGKLKAPLKKTTDKYERLCLLDQLRLETRPIYIPTGKYGRKTKKTRQPKVDDQGRLALQIAAQNRLAIIAKFKNPKEAHQKEKEQIEKLLSWLAIYNKWAKEEKLRTSYTSYPVGRDKRCHPHYLIHGTATGRLACTW